MKLLPEPVDVSVLMLDPENPRLPEGLQGSSQADILAYLFEHDVLDELAESYLANGFFPNEQLLVLPPDEFGSRLVVEGNRRLGALKYLLREQVAVEAGLPEHVTDPPVPGAVLEGLKLVPVVELESRSELSAYLGFRHISGLKTWAPEAKARYLFAEVEKAQASGADDPFYSVGRQVGSNALGVRNAYHAYNTLRVARDELGLRDAASFVLSRRFGVWTRLLGTANAASFMGIGQLGREYATVANATSSMAPGGTEAVLNDLRPAEGKSRALLQDSRDVTDYSAVLGDVAALEVLRRYERLDLAAEIAHGSDFDLRLQRANESLQVATTEVLDGVNVTPASAELAKSVLDSARNLLALVQANVAQPVDKP